MNAEVSGSKVYASVKLYDLSVLEIPCISWVMSRTRDSEHPPVRPSSRSEGARTEKSWTRERWRFSGKIVSECGLIF